MQVTLCLGVFLMEVRGEKSEGRSLGELDILNESPHPFELAQHSEER